MKIVLNFVKQQQNETFLTCVSELENALLKNPQINLQVLIAKSNLLKKLLLKLIIRIPTQLQSLFFFKGKCSNINIAALMGVDFVFLMPRFYWSKNNYVYMFDAWPRFHKLIIVYSKLFNINTIFFSSENISKKFNSIHSTIKSFWIPEGIDLTHYSWKSYIHKDIDVLEFGRRYDLYHHAIRKTLKQNKKKHLFEKVKGQVVFKSKADFLNGLSRSKITICIPADITHPERSEDISSMTQRYLQSMAAKCLIVGLMPKEMKRLFDYNPIVEIDMARPAEQLSEVLNNYNQYYDLIEKNYRIVKRNHTWDVRVQQMLDIIQNEL